MKRRDALRRIGKSGPVRDFANGRRVRSGAGRRCPVASSTGPANDPSESARSNSDSEPHVRGSKPWTSRLAQTAHGSPPFVLIPSFVQGSIYSPLLKSTSRTAS